MSHIPELTTVEVPAQSLRSGMVLSDSMSRYGPHVVASIEPRPDDGKVHVHLVPNSTADTNSDRFLWPLERVAVLVDSAATAQLDRFLWNGPAQSREQRQQVQREHIQGLVGGPRAEPVPPEQVARDYFGLRDVEPKNPTLSAPSSQQFLSTVRANRALGLGPKDIEVER